MSFSFRSLFQRGAGSNEPAHGAQQYFAAGAHPQRAAGTGTNSLSSMQASPSLHFPAGASPFQIGGSPLFKTAGNESIAAPPINSSAGMSPFSIAGATPTNAPLTVGDVINQLPPEVVRMGALPLEQPLSLPPALLENALRSGQAALPVFELYRVCPALFQVPVSPQDPRLVALPASKLPGLIAQAREGNAASQPQAPAPSPFSLGQSAPPATAATGSPFQMAQPAAEVAAQQPQASPFSLGASPAALSFGSSAQQTAAAPAAAPASPFSIGTSPGGSPFSLSPQPAASAPPAPPPGSPFSFGASSSGSPFGMSQEPAPAASSPFALGATPVGSPFGMSPQPGSPAPAAFSSAPAPAENRSAQPSASGQNQASISVLFTPQSQQRASTPSDAAAAPALPFGSPFVSSMKEAAAPAESPAPNAFAPQPQPPAAAPSPGHAPAASGLAKLGFSAVLSGYSYEELGFNPATLPAWITTSVQASALNEQISSGTVVLDLGTLIDGITDLGFRNTLATARRDFRIKLPQNEVFHALTNMSAAPPAFSAPGPAAAVAPARLSVQPITPQQPAQNSQPMFAAPSAQVPEASSQRPLFGAALTQFGQSQPAAAPAQFSSSPSSAASALVSAFGSPQPASGPAQFDFAPPAASPSPASIFASAQPAGSPAKTAFTSPSEVSSHASAFGSPKSAEAPAQFAFAPPAAASAPVSPFGSAQPQAGAPAPFSFSPSAPRAEPASAPPASPLFPPAQQPTSSAPSGPLQPLAGAFQSFGTPSSPPAGHPPAGTAKPFDPFASSATGSLAPKSLPESGFSSAQLLGQAPSPQQQPPPALASAPEVKPSPGLFAPAASAPFQATPSFAPALEEIPSFSTPAAAAPAPQPVSRGLFSTQAVNVPSSAKTAAPQTAPEPKSPPAAPAAATASAPAKMAAVKHSFLGLSPLDTQTDQLLLRALLGTEEKLAAPRVVELLALQPGLSACVCLHGSHVLSHADSSKADAVEFQRQAPDIARQLRGLAPLIGIDGAETFTLNAGGRLLTFCFPENSIIGVLHDVEPSTGMRDKITLIARELARMLG